MKDFRINDYTLNQEAKEIAAAAMREEKEYGTDAEQMLHEMCEGHQWVIYTKKAFMLCAECDTSEGEDYLDDYGFATFGDYGFESVGAHATKLAYATLLSACREAYAELKDKD